MHSFSVAIYRVESTGYWWVTVSGEGALAVRTIGKTFPTEQEAVDFAKKFIAGYRKKP